MSESSFANGLKEAASCVRRFEAESETLKKSVAAANEKIARMDKEAEALKIAMDLSLQPQQVAEVMDKFAVLMTKDLSVVKEAMNLDLTKQASLGDVYEADEQNRYMDPTRAFVSILRGK